MKSFGWKDRAELVGIAAILIGLYFVYAEIQQNSTIARAELNMIIYQDMLAVDQRLSDADFARIYTKALTSPKELTAEERLQVNSMLGTVANIFRRERQLYGMGIFLEYENMPRYLARKYFSSEYGRAYWAVESRTMPESLRQVVDEELARDKVKIDHLNFDNEVVKKLYRD